MKYDRFETTYAYLTLNLELVASKDCRQITEFRDPDNRNGIKRQNHLVGNTVLLAERSFVLQVSQSGIIV